MKRIRKVKFTLDWNPHYGPPYICIKANHARSEVGKLIAAIEPKGKIRLDYIDVDPNFRRQGIAGEMFEKMLDEAKRNFPDKKFFSCYVYPIPSGERYTAISMTEVENFYIALGFKKANKDMWEKEL